MPPFFSENFHKLIDRCAIPGLIRFVVLFNALVFILHLLVPGFINTLTLDPDLVLQGQVWRLITWIFIPETLSPFWIFFALLFLLYVGDGLEQAIGISKLTLFYLGGVGACTLVAFVFGLAGSGMALARANTFLNLSLLLAYATVFPNFQVLVFFVIPMRVAWLALFSAVMMILSTLGEPPVVAATLGVAFLNYFLFFHKELQGHLASLQINRKTILPSPLTSTLFGKSKKTPIETLHRCEVCDRTEISHPDLDFRVSSNGSEYCREHLPSSQSSS